MSHPIPRASIWPNVVFDTTDDAGMAAAQAWVTGLAAQTPVVTRTGANSTRTGGNTNGATGGAHVTTTEWVNTWTPPETNRSAQDVRDGDTWEVRDGRATIVGSNDWEAPKPGTHESDLCDEGVVCCQLCALNRHYIPALTDAELGEFNYATAWSQTTTEDTSQ